MEQNHIVSLEAKHAKLDQQIRQEAMRPHPDESLLTRLKKLKLRIKEELAHL